MLIKRLLLAVISIAFGVIVTIGITVAIGTTPAEYGFLYFTFTALALAIAHEPRVLFLDEPTAGLDVASRTELHRVMRELRNNGTAIILATHDMAEAEQLSDQIAILLNGRLVATGTPMDITATGSGLTKVSVHTKSNLLLANQHTFPAVSQRQVKEVYAIYYSSDISQTVPALINYVQDKADELIDLRVERPSLEERFLELTHV